MAHDLETQNGKTSFASFREPAWHGLGTVFTEEKTTSEMLEAANLNGWNVRLEDMPIPSHLTSDKEYQYVVRTNPTTNTQTDVLGVVGERYHVLQNVSISSNINKVVATSVISLKSNNNTTEFFQQISPTKVDSSAMTNNLIKSQNVENKNSNFYSSYFKHLYGNNNDKRINYEKPYEKPDKQKFSYHINESKKVEGKFPFLPKKSSNHNLGNTLSGNNRYNNIQDEIRKSEEVNYFLTPTFNKNSSKSQIGSSQYSISNMANSHKFDRSDFTKIY